MFFSLKLDSFVCSSCTKIHAIHSFLRSHHRTEHRSQFLRSFLAGITTPSGRLDHRLKFALAAGCSWVWVMIGHVLSIVFQKPTGTKDPWFFAWNSKLRFDHIKKALSCEAQCSLHFQNPHEANSNSGMLLCDQPFTWHVLTWVNWFRRSYIEFRWVYM